MGDQQDQDLQLLKNHLEQLGEHFDSVQIFATRHEHGTLDGTVTVQLGTGNWYARYGQIHEWLIKNDESARHAARKSDETD